MSVKTLVHAHRDIQGDCHAAIALEAFGTMGFGSEILTKLKNFFTSSKNHIDETTTKLSGIDTKNQYKGKPLKLPTFSEAAKRDYLDNTSLKLYVSERFKGNFVEYAKFLLDAQSVLSRIDVDLISPFTAYIGEAIMKPHLLHAGSFKPSYKIEDTSVYVDKMKTFFTQKVGATTTWGDAFARNSEVTELLLIMGNVDANYKKMDPKSVKRAIDDLNDHLDTLFNMLESADLGTIIDAKHIEYVTDSILMVAKQVELYSVIYYAIMAFKKALTDSDVSLKTQL